MSSRFEEFFNGVASYVTLSCCSCSCCSLKLSRILVLDLEVHTFFNSSHILSALLIEVTTTYAPERTSSPSPFPSTVWKTAEPSSVSSTELKSTEYSISPPLPSEGQLPVEKKSRKTAKEGWMTNTRIGLITGGFALLLCLCAIVMIALLR